MIISGTFIPAKVDGFYYAQTPAGIRIADGDASYYNQGIEYSNYGSASDTFGYDVANPKVATEDDDTPVIILVKVSVTKEEDILEKSPNVVTFKNDDDTYVITSDYVEFRDFHSNDELSKTDVKDELQITDAELDDIVKYAESYASQMMQYNLEHHTNTYEDWLKNPYED